ncbi:NADH-quinone oxidoreductase subunit A [Fulvivirga sp. 29W222]|uniref:NADH-quinone oxidoreductase subunit A n=1 Tax=Fulvivirga marina TaxID=2494733 RepID=A0A937FY41_9BACT|nr:NADH-quinone oxidoreductase subunit A [Fulvivirga marina]MBL6447127.1 NADH-quinone oxidoreductase subunit A [Fulvivirga marina]
MDIEISAFGEILIFLIGGVLFIMGGLVTSWIIRPDRPNEEKLQTYESGEQPLSSAWARFNIRFYIIALLFVLFEVEIVFLFPWATVFGRGELVEQTDGLWGWFALIEMVVFILVLALGLAWAWVRGYLEWPKTEQREEEGYKSPVPKELYDNINNKYSRS